MYQERGGVVEVKVFAEKPRIQGLRESAVGKTFLECYLELVLYLNIANAKFSANANTFHRVLSTHLVA